MAHSMWESMSSSVKRRPTQDWCAFYTPQGRMVSKPAGKRPRHMHPEDWCAQKHHLRKSNKELLMAPRKSKAKALRLQTQNSMQESKLRQSVNLMSIHQLMQMAG